MQQDLHGRIPADARSIRLHARQLIFPHLLTQIRNTFESCLQDNSDISELTLTGQDHARLYLCVESEARMRRPDLVLNGSL